MDGTAGRQFSTLRRRLQQLGIELVITHLPPARYAQDPSSHSTCMSARSLVAGAVQQPILDRCSVYNSSAVAQTCHSPCSTSHGHPDGGHMLQAHLILLIIILAGNGAALIGISAEHVQ